VSDESSVGGSGARTVVVPAGHGGSSLACIRSLSRRGYRVVGVAGSADAAALQSRHCDEREVAPAPGTDLPGYREALLELARRDEVLTVLPLYEPDIAVLAEYREQFAEHVATPWSDHETVRTAQDGHRLAQVAAEAGVPTPECGLLDEWDDWSERRVIKPRYALCVEDGTVRYPEVHVTEPGEVPDVDAIVEEMGHVPIVQEFIPGNAEGGYFALCDHGEPVARFQHRRIRSYTYAGGASVYREARDDPDLDAVGRRLLEALDWHGPAMVEVKRDPRDGEYKLVEVNPRFWGSLPLAVAAGVDFPAAYCDLARGDVDPTLAYDTDVGCHELLGEVSYLHSVLRYDYDHVEPPSLPTAVADIARSLVTQPHFDYLSVEDPRPFVQQLRTLV
jgi:predicted ATP-grasp superfamily ATP-dependent carboligase